MSLKQNTLDNNRMDKNIVLHMEMESGESHVIVMQEKRTVEKVKEAINLYGYTVFLE